MRFTRGWNGRNSPDCALVEADFASAIISEDQAVQASGDVRGT